MQPVNISDNINTLIKFQSDNYYLGNNQKFHS